MNLIPIFELALKGTAVLIAGYGGAALLARSSAAHRSLLWLGVFSVLLLLPVAIFIRPLWSVSLPIAWPSAFTPAAAPLPAQPMADVIRETSPARRQPLGLEQWLAAIYGCGVGGVLVFRLVGAAQLRSLRRAAAADPASQAIVDQWRESVGMRRPIRTLTSDRVTVPMTWGLWRPVIVLPADSQGWAPEELHGALLHEFAHGLHGDAGRRWLGTVVAALWWPHPLVWAAIRAWKLEQELACDNVVLNAGGDAAAYAQQLLAAARGLRLSQFQSAAALVMAMPAGLEERLRSVVSANVDRSPARKMSFLGCTALTVFALAMGLAIQTRSVAAPPNAPASPAAPAKPARANSIEKLAQETVIPELNLRNATVKEALTLIATKSGIKIQYTEAAPSDARITLSLAGIPAAEAIKFVVNLANLKMTYEKDHVWVDGRQAGGASNAAGVVTTYSLGPVN